MDPSITAQAPLAAAVAGAPHADERKESDTGQQPMDIDGQRAIARLG